MLKLSFIYIINCIKKQFNRSFINTGEKKSNYFQNKNRKLTLFFTFVVQNRINTKSVWKEKKTVKEGKKSFQKQ